MSVNVSKYVNLNENYAIYGINGYFLEPFLIKMMIIDEIKLGMSFVELERFIEECEISVTEDEIKKFLDKKPGDISGLYKKGIGVVTGDGEIILTDIKPFGKKRMNAFSYINGLRDKDKINRVY